MNKKKTIIFFTFMVILLMGIIVSIILLTKNNLNEKNEKTKETTTSSTITKKETKTMTEITESDAKFITKFIDDYINLNFDTNISEKKEALESDMTPDILNQTQILNQLDQYKKIVKLYKKEKIVETNLDAQLVERKVIELKTELQKNGEIKNYIKIEETSPVSDEPSTFNRIITIKIENNKITEFNEEYIGQNQ